MNTNFSDSFGWEVQSHPIQFTNSEGIVCTDKNFQILTKDNDDTVLSVMSKNYTPMSISQFEEATERMVDISKMTFNGYQEFDNGKIVLSILENDTPLLVDGFPIKDYLILGNSFNGEQPFFIGNSTVLIRCQNQFSKIAKMSTVRHTKTSPEKREFLFESLKIYFENRNEMYSNFNAMAKVGINDNDKIRFVNEVLNINSSLDDEELATRTINRRNELLDCIAQETGEIGDNVFGLFNGLTKYTTHVLKTRKESPFGNIVGSASNINLRGYQKAISMMRAA